MSRIPCSLNNSDTAVNRNIDKSLYDNVKLVADNIYDVVVVSDDLNLGGWSSVKDNGSIIDAVTIEPQGVSVIKNVSDHMTDITNANTNMTLIQQAPTNATNASNSATSALASKNLAEKWASERENIEVITGKYSAFHWAQKAQSSLSTVYTKAESDARYVPLGTDFNLDLGGL